MRKLIAIVLLLLALATQGLTNEMTSSTVMTTSTDTSAEDDASSSTVTSTEQDSSATHSSSTDVGDDGTTGSTSTENDDTTVSTSAGNDDTTSSTSTEEDDSTSTGSSTEHDDTATHSTSTGDDDTTTHDDDDEDDSSTTDDSTESNEITGSTHSTDDNTMNSTDIESTTVTQSPGSCHLEGEDYDSGTQFQDNCMRFFCQDSKWYTSNKYNYLCGECSFNNDPHFTTFDRTYFDWHGHSTYVMTQVGDEDCPEVYVNSELDYCWRNSVPTCVKTVHFQPQPNTTIEIVKDDSRLSNSKITIDGHEQTATDAADNELTLLKGGDGEEHPAFAWMKDGCIHVMGTGEGGYLVKICSWGSKVLAHPNMKSSDLSGLCGDWDGDASNDLQYRDGSPPNQTDDTQSQWVYYNIETELGNDWEIKNCAGNEDALLKIKSQVTPRNIENPCTANDTEIEGFYQNCQDALGDDVDDNLLKECTFDQCIAIEAGEDDLAAQWLNNSRLLVLEEQQQKEDTVNYDDDDNSSVEPETTDDTSLSGLTDGEIAGIVIGSIAGVALIGGGIFCFIKKKLCFAQK